MNVTMTSIDKIKVTDRIRADLGDLNELAATIKERGVLQPITIDDRFELLMGGRRLAAAKLAGLLEVPTIVRPYTDDFDHAEIELLENVHRRDLHWTEHLAAIERIHEHAKKKNGTAWWSMNRTAKFLGMDPAYIARMKQSRSLAEQVPEALKEPSVDKARKLAKKTIEAALTNLAVKQVEKTSDSSSLLHRAKIAYKIGDALVGLQGVNPGVFNFAEVDPPYAVDLAALRTKTELADTYTDIPAEQYSTFILQAGRGVFKALSDNSFCVWWYPIIHHETVRLALTEAGFRLDNIPAIWYKSNYQAETNDPNSLLASSWEPFFICRKGQPALRKRARSNVFSIQPLPNANRGHPAERPVSLILEILDTFTWPKARVLCPFLGSGNTILACYQRDLVAVGWDLEQKHKDYFLGNVTKMQVNSV